jgi:hypothetical protein
VRPSPRRSSIKACRQWRLDMLRLAMNLVTRTLNRSWAWEGKAP